MKKLDAKNTIKFLPYFVKLRIDALGIIPKNQVLLGFLMNLSTTMINKNLICIKN